jgi:hypothetical protein
LTMWWYRIIRTGYARASPSSSMPSTKSSSGRYVSSRPSRNTGSSRETKGVVALARGGSRVGSGVDVDVGVGRMITGICSGVDVGSGSRVKRGVGVGIGANVGVGVGWSTGEPLLASGVGVGSGCGVMVASALSSATATGVWVAVGVGAGATVLVLVQAASSMIARLAATVNAALLWSPDKKAIYSMVRHHYNPRSGSGSYLVPSIASDGTPRICSKTVA